MVNKPRFKIRYFLQLLNSREIIAKILFDDKDCSVATKFEYGTPYAETMTSDEFDEVFEKRLNKFIENERSGQSM